jgi:hypothetical protein
MSADAKPPEPLSLRRWSRRKLEAAREKANAAAETGPVVVPAPVAPAAPADAPEPARAASPAAAPPPAAELPPVQSLTIDSDFRAFLQPGVADTLKRQALKQLFRDPRFNVMDGLDVYIDDYSKPDPISPDVVRQMVQGRYVFAPPPTRINAEGHAEDVPPDAAAGDAPVETLAAAGDPPPAPLPDAAASEPRSAAAAEPAVDAPTPGVAAPRRRPVR